MGNCKSSACHDDGTINKIKEEENENEKMAATSADLSEAILTKPAVSQLEQGLSDGTDGVLRSGVPSREVTQATSGFSDDGRAPEVESSVESDGASDRSSAAGSDDGASTVSISRSHKRRAKNKLKMVNTMGFIPSAALLVVPDSRGKLEDNYQMLDQELGKGGFAVVKKASVRVTSAKRAVKVISKSDKNNPGLLKAEIEIMKKLDHPNILTLFEIFEDDDSLCLVLELCQGDQLEKWVEANGSLKEVEAAWVMKHTLRAVNYLHSISVVHRDIKAPNCLLVSKGPLDLNNDVKLSDFGLSCTFKKSTALTQKCGTPSHMAPEVFRHSYTKSCDMWSVGAMLFYLLTRHMPFGKEGLHDDSAKGRLNFSNSSWVDKSQEAVTIVSSMLSKNASLRIKADQALRHPWIMKNAPKPPPEIIEQKHLDALKNYRSLNKFKRASLNMLACMLGEAEIGPSRRLFNALDENGDGLISMPELIDKVNQAHAAAAKNKPQFMQKKEAQHIFTFAGEGGQHAASQQEFSYTEFVAATVPRRKYINDKIGKVIFNSFDKDGDGNISLSELVTGKLLGNLRAEELVQALKDLDLNGDSNLDFQEFMEMMKS